MEKRELLRSLGYSEQLLDKVDSFEKSHEIKIKQHSFVHENLEFRTADSTELVIRDEQKSVDSVKIVYQR